MSLYRCTLCSELAGEIEGNLFRSYFTDHELRSRVISETENFVAIPSLGQIVEGYLLICTRAHYLSMGSALLKKPLADELATFKNRLKRHLYKLYGSKCIVFEHGPASPTNRAGCCTDHAHVHLVPVDVDLITPHKSMSLEWIECGDEELKQYAARGDAYLYFENADGRRFSAAANFRVPSQLFRRLLANAIGRYDDWDWRQTPYVDRVASVVRRFSARRAGEEWVDDREACGSGLELRQKPFDQ
jgi:ATP adenylyltransferase